MASRMAALSRVITTRRLVPKITANSFARRSAVVAAPSILCSVSSKQFSHQADVIATPSADVNASINGPLTLHPRHRAHLLFGANTDVGKSIVSSGLLRAASMAAKNDWSSANNLTYKMNYIKPLQCGGSDESFVQSHNSLEQDGEGPSNHEGGIIQSQTLFTWQTPASPHLASRLENHPVSDDEVLAALRSSWQNIINEDCENKNVRSTTIIETAGGIMSPSSSSPLNHANNATNANDNDQSKNWKWSTQADLYSNLQLPVVFVGDPRLGGISVTLSSLEALWSRGYHVDAVVFIEASKDNDDKDSVKGIEFGRGNAEALKEFIAMNKERTGKRLIEEDAIIYLPELPPMPIPLDHWYETNENVFLNLHYSLDRQWTEHVR